MSDFRFPSAEYTEDDFTNKSTFGLTFAGSTLTGFTIDGQAIAHGASVSDTLTALKETIEEFEEDDANGTEDPTELVLQCAAGGPLLTRTVTNTLLIAPRPAVPFARIVALRMLLEYLGY